MEKYYENFFKEGKEKDHSEFINYLLDLTENDEETKTGQAFAIEEFLTMNPTSAGKIMDSVSTDSSSVAKFKAILDGYSDRQKIWSLLSSTSPKMFDKLKSEMGEEDSWKADVNKDLGDLGF